VFRLEGGGEGADSKKKESKLPFIKSCISLSPSECAAPVGSLLDFLTPIAVTTAVINDELSPMVVH